MHVNTIFVALQVECTNGCVVLKRQNFIWNANEFCQHFKEANNAATFVSKFISLSTRLGDKVLVEGEGTIPNLELPPSKKPRLDTTESTIIISNDEADTSKWLDTLDYEIEKQKVGKHS